MKLYVATACMALAATMAFADAVGAQTVRQRTQEPVVPPGIQKPDYSPGSQAMSALILKVDALQQKVDALQQSAGRQVVVLNFKSDSGSQYSNSQTYEYKSNDYCKKALGDRFGRVISRTPIQREGMWYLDEIVCETAP